MVKQVTQYCPERAEIDVNTLVNDDADFSLEAFDKRTVAFFNAVSRLLLSNKKYNRVPEIVALGFWLREAGINKMHKENQQWMESPLFSVNPLGIVFHVAPSNVDTIFLYSTCISLLMGNKNIVRLSSSRSSPIVDFIIEVINEVIAITEYNIFKNYIAIVTYGHDEELNSFFSANCKCRVIWGGDNTVKHFKAIDTPAYVKDINFPNRLSYSLFKATAFLEADEKIKQNTAYNFFNDSYTFDQLGCSSPKMIFVLGTETEKQQFAKEFYQHVIKVTQTHYHEQAEMLSIQKFNHLIDDTLSLDVSTILDENNSLYLVETLNDNVDLNSCLGGYFYIKHIIDISAIKETVLETAQTLTYFGISSSELQELNKSLYGKRIDRVVPVGQALSFNYIWDGMNLFEELSRKRLILKSSE